MNFAFQALLFFILLLPGLLLRSNYNGRIAKELVLPQNYPPFSREAIRILVYAALLNIIWVSFSNYAGKWFNFEVNLQSVLFLLMGDYSDTELQREAINSIKNHPTKVLLYFSTLYVFSAILGYKLHKYIRSAGLDKKYKIFRFNNQWHYVLTGEIMEFPDTNEVPVEVDFVSASAVINDYLYIGIIADYELDGRGNLSKLTLQQSYRRKLKDDQSDGQEESLDIDSDPRYYRIKGDYLLLDCEKTTNINIDYYYVAKEP